MNCPCTYLSKTKTLFRPHRLIKHYINSINWIQLRVENDIYTCTNKFLRNSQSPRNWKGFAREGKVCAFMFLVLVNKIMFVLNLFKVDNLFLFSCLLKCVKCNSYLTQTYISPLMKIRLHKYFFNLWWIYEFCVTFIIDTSLKYFIK